MSQHEPPRTSNHPMAIVCDIGTMTREELQRHVADAQRLFAGAEELQPLRDGWAVRLAEAPDMLARAADLLAMNRLCCPHLRQTLIVEPHRGAVWLNLTGPEGSKEALAAELVGLLRDEVASAGGMKPSRYPAWLEELDALTERELGVGFAQLHGRLQMRGVRPFDAFNQNATPTEFFERHVRQLARRSAPLTD